MKQRFIGPFLVFLLTYSIPAAGAGGDLCQPPKSKHLLKQAQIQQVPLRHIQLGFEYLQDQRLYHLPK